MALVTLLDARGLMLRHYHACSVRSLVDADGAPVTSWQDGLATYVERFLIPLASQGTRMQDVYACWDGGNSYRTALFPEYKKARKGREECPIVREQLRTLKVKLQRLLMYLGIRNVTAPGEEADDLIALLVERLDASSFLIHTNDRDLLQLLSPRVVIQAHDTLYVYGNASLFKDFVPVPLIAVYKALCGDHSDGFAGIPQFGEAAFKALLSAYGEDGLLQIQAGLEANDWSVTEAAYTATNDKNLFKILQHWSQAQLCLQLAKLHPDACFGSTGSGPKRPSFNVRVPHRQTALDTLTEIGMPSAIQYFEHLFPQEYLIESGSHDQLVAFSSEIVASPIVSWDYESTDKLKHPAFKLADKRKQYVDVLSQEVAGISVNFGKHSEKTIYVPFDHSETGNFSKDWLTWLLGVIDSRPGRSVAHNATFELAVSQCNLGYLPRAPYDTRIMASYVDENLEAGLKFLSMEHLAYSQASYKEVTRGRDMCDLTGQEVLRYGCDDSLVTSHLFALFKAIMQLEGSWGFYCENEVEPVVNDVLDFIEGQEIDWSILSELTRASEQSIKENMARLRRLLEENCNTASDQEVYARALNLYSEWIVVEEPKYQGEPAKLEELRQRIWRKAWNACFYTPSVEKEEALPAFSPTKTGINKVIALIDPEAPKLDRVTGPGIEEFETQVAGYLQGKTLSCCTELEQFTDRLFKARKELTPARRSGPTYELLEEFCNAVLKRGTTGKVVIEGDELNCGSSQQMQALLYGKLGLAVRRRSKVDENSLRDKLRLPGAPATGLKAVAAAFANDIVEPETDWRAAALTSYGRVVTERQAQSLFYLPYPLWAHPRDGRLHPQIVNCGTVTRRPTGNSPNPFQITKSGALRSCFVAGGYGDGDRVVVSADLVNQELVFLACESKDPVMLDAFSSTPRKDVHSLTATSFAHILFPRLGVKELSSQLDYDTFMAIRKGSMGDDVAKIANQIRNKYAKACIAEGSLVLTDRGLVPIEKVALSDKVWDGVEWVNHEGVIYKGIQEVIMYDGLTATPDHKVFTQDGSEVSIGACASQQAGPRLAVGEIEGSPVRYDRDNFSAISQELQRYPSTGGEKQKVYDIVNAGPRHRFTVSGKIVRNCNFLIAYGGSFGTLADNLLIPKELAQELVNGTFQKYPMLRQWQYEVVELARQQGYIETCYGMRRHATKDLYSSDEGLRKRMERQMINVPMQAGSADLLKTIRQSIVDRDMHSRYRMKAVKPVYDEITASVPVDLAIDYCMELKEVMEVVPPGYPVGMLTEFSIGRAWGGQVEAKSTAREGISAALEEALG